MANRLAEILKQEYKSKGLVSGTISGLGKRAREKLDIRNALFSDNTLGGAIGQKIFGKGYSATKKQSSDISNKVSSLDTGSSVILEEININSRISAKNSTALPQIGRDINVMKQGIVKLVKLNGGTQRDKADRFFMRSQDRENSYEAQFGKKSPTKLGGNENKEEGWLSKLLSGGFGGILSSFINTLIKGGLIVGALSLLGSAIKTFFTDEKFRSEVFGAIKGFFGSTFGENMLIGLAGVAAAFALFRVTVIGLAAVMEAISIKMAASFGIPGVGLKGNKSVPKGGIKGRGKFGMFAGIAAMLGAGAYAGNSFAGDNESSGQTGIPGTNPTQQNSSLLGGAAGAATLGIVGANMAFGRALKDTVSSKVGGAVSLNEKMGAGGRFVKEGAGGMKTAVAAKDLPIGKILEKFRTFAYKASKKGWMMKIFALVVKRLGVPIALKISAFLAGLAAAPFSAGLSTLLSVASALLLAYDIYSLYDHFFGSNGIESELEKSDKETQKLKEEKGNTSPTEEPKPEYEYSFKSFGGTGQMEQIDPKTGNFISKSTSPTSSSSDVSVGNVKGVGETGTTKEAMEFFVGKGWTQEQAAGIVGNLQAESGANLRTDAIGDGGKGYGIAQWHSDRQDLFQKTYGKPIRQAGFKEQLEFVNWELNNSEKKAGNALKGATSADEAAAIFDQYYERSSGAHRQKRMANALALIKQPGSTPQFASVPMKGIKLSKASTEIAAAKTPIQTSPSSSAPASSTTNNYNVAGGSNGGYSPQPYDTDFYRELMRPVII